MMWNRLRYTVWAPAYDRIVGAAGLNAARRLSIDRLRLAAGDRVLIVGAGTGLDFDFLPPNVDITAIDITPAMLKRLEARAAGRGRSVTTHVMDARQLAFRRLGPLVAATRLVVEHDEPVAFGGRIGS